MRGKGIEKEKEKETNKKKAHTKGSHLLEGRYPSFIIIITQTIRQLDLPEGREKAKAIQLPFTYYFLDSLKSNKLIDFSGTVHK